MTEDEMVGWHHRLDGHEFEQAPGVGDGQGGPACCNPRGHKESDTTEQMNRTVPSAVQSAAVNASRSLLTPPTCECVCVPSHFSCGHLWVSDSIMNWSIDCRKVPTSFFHLKMASLFGEHFVFSPSSSRCVSIVRPFLLLSGLLWCR